MRLISIPTNEFSTRIHDLWKNRWFLLTAGDFEQKKYNTMTVAWGSLGIMWNKPFAQVVVRPTRYTFDFINQYDTFTLSAFSKEFQPALLLLGSKSGRDGDKIAGTGLSVIKSQKVAAPAFAEAELIIECQKIYWDDLKPANFLNSSIIKNYPQKDFHRIYFGEILAIHGVSKYVKS